MKILFVIQQLDFADHIAIAYLSAIAKQQNHSTYFCSLRNNDLNIMVDEIKPDILAYSANILGFKELVNANKKAQNIHKCISILGGPQATFSPETFEESGMDIFVMGEGDYPFRDFLDRVNKNSSYDDIDNLITKKSKNGVRDLIENLDELPITDRDLVLSNSYLKNTPKKTFYTSRGCIYSCHYCCNDHFQKLYKNKGKIFRRFSVERVINEMEYVGKKYKMDFVKIGDDLFAFQTDQWIRDFVEQYSKRINKPFNCYLRIDRVNNDLLKLLKKAGCFSVNLSIDSTSSYIREHILNRNMKPINIVKELQRINDFGINTFVNYMLAIPESKLEDDLNTIQINRKGKVTYTSYTTTEPMKGTKLYDLCVNRNYINSNTFVSDMTHMFEKSPLSCFNEKEKNIRYNIFLLGQLVSKLPKPLYLLGLWIIKNIPPNKFFQKIRQWIYQYYIENKIFVFSKKAKKIKYEKI